MPATEQAGSLKDAKQPATASHSQAGQAVPSKPVSDQACHPAGKKQQKHKKTVRQTMARDQPAQTSVSDFVVFVLFLCFLFLLYGFLAGFWLAGLLPGCLVLSWLAVY